MHKWKHNYLQSFMTHRRLRNAINFHSISRKKKERFLRKLTMFWVVPLLQFSPGALICSVIKSFAKAFTVHIPCIKTQSRPQVWAFLFELIKPPRGLGELDRWLSLVCFVASNKATPPQHLFFTHFRASTMSAWDEVWTRIIEKSTRVGGLFTFQTLMHIAFATLLHLLGSRLEVL